MVEVVSCIILHQNNDPKHPASSIKEFIRANKWKVLDCPSKDLNLIKHEFHQLKRRVKAETPQNKQHLELAALKAGESTSKDETKSLVMSMGHVYGYFCLMFNCPNTYAHINEWDEL